MALRQKVRQIGEGWINWIFENKNVEPIAIYRANICQTCEFMSDFGYAKCMKCDTVIKCPIVTKVRCHDCKCPLNFW